MRLRSIVLNLGLAAGSVLAALIGLELILRAVPSLMPEEAQIKIHWRRLAAVDTAKTKADKYIGFLYSAGSGSVLQHSDLRFSFQMDSHGFRNPAPWPSRADVVAVGDSWVFSYGVNDADAWPRQVERELSAGRVMNLGLSGYGPEQYNRVYQMFGMPLHPKVLLYGIFPGNDLRDTEDFAAWLDAGGPGNYNVWRTAGRMRQLNTPIVGRSYVALLFRESWKNRRARFGGRTVTWGDGKKLRLTGGLYQADASHAHPGDPEFEQALAAVERARELAEAQGTHFVALLFPTKEEIYLPLVGQPSPQALAPFVPELRRRGIDFIDFSEPFTREARAGRSVYFELDPHPNPAGYRVIAQTVTAYLKQHAAELQLDGVTAALTTPRLTH